jgi:hypothetical protein
MNLKGIDIVLPYWAAAGLMSLSIVLTLALSRPGDAQGA